MKSSRLRKSKDKPKSSKPRRSRARSISPSNKGRRKNNSLNKELLNSPSFKRRKLRRDLKLNALSKSSLPLKQFKNQRLLPPRKLLLELTSPD